MTEHTEVSNRYRINVSISTKGIKTYDCTVEMSNSTIEEVLQESDKLVEELDKRYPVNKES